MSFSALFGESLKSKSGDVNTNAALNAKTVAVYFSAHWCPPCRAFTPKLAEFYNTHKDAKNFEVVFVTGDNDEAQFEEYYNEMPWLALPFGSQHIDQLNAKFEVQGIPSLILLDPQGNTITKKGRQQVMTDPNAESFPWVPRTYQQIIAGPLISSNKDSSTIQYSELKGKVIGLYFSAHWCPPCRNFTPILAEFYNKNKERLNLEIIFSSRDKDEESYQEYYGEMPWVSLPFKDARNSELADLFELEGIPCLVFVDHEGNVICSDATARVREDPEGKEFPWAPKAAYRFTDGVLRRHLLSSAVLLAKATNEEAKEKVPKLNELFNSASFEKEIHVFLFTEEDQKESPVLQRIFELAGIGEKNEVIVLNFLEGRKFESEEKGSLETIEKMVSDYCCGRLELASLQ